MGILSLASGKSLDRGYQYFKDHKVLSFSQKDEFLNIYDPDGFTEWDDAFDDDDDYDDDEDYFCDIDDED